MRPIAELIWFDINFCKKKPVFCQRCLPSPPSSPHLSPALLATKSFLKLNFLLGNVSTILKRFVNVCFPRQNYFWSILSFLFMKISL